MKDDLLIRFIDGKTTPEEAELVLEELSRDGEATKEWMQMVEGARLADTIPMVNIDPDDFISRTLAKTTVVRPERRKLVRLPWIISGITAVAASVAVVVTVVINNANVDIPYGLSAEMSDTAAVISNVDSTIMEKELDIKKLTHPAVADRINTQKPQEQLEEFVGHKILQDDKTATASQTEVSLFEIVRPAKSPYRVRVKNLEKEFVFEWNMSNVSDVRFSITDKDGKIIIGKECIVENSYGVVASYLVDRGELDWTVEVTFNDGLQHRKTGKIELVSIKE